MDGCLDESNLKFLWTVTNALLPLGGVIGGLSSGFMADYFGRKNSMFIMNICVLTTAILNIISKFIPSYRTLMASRFLTGIFSGFFSGVVPVIAIFFLIEFKSI